ncbi:MAG: permease, partial [Anaerolineales bacterium]|nr:permease [Anaerolineales bacterium]
METLQPVFDFVLSHLLKIWPFLLVTIPIAAAVNLFGAAQHINRAFQARPIIAIFLATAVGAFSPLCSCTVIPVIASLLIGGVPLAPVMSFWVASPS